MNFQKFNSFFQVWNQSINLTTSLWDWYFTNALLRTKFSYFSTLFSGFSSDPWQQSQPSNMAMIKDLQVQCEKDMMRVRVLFDRPFYGMVFSKGHYSNINCVHVPSGLGQTQVSLHNTGWTICVRKPQNTYNTYVLDATRAHI